MAATRATRAFVGVLAWVVVGLLVTGIAVAEEPPEYRSNFGPDGTASSGFDFASSVAADQIDGAVYVIDRNQGSIFKFDMDGTPVGFTGAAPYLLGNELTGLTFSVGVGLNQIAVDTNNHLFYAPVDGGESLAAFQADGEPALFTAGAGSGTNEIGGFASLTGVAVDSSGNIYLSENKSGAGETDVVRILEASGEEITEFEVDNPGNLAVDGAGSVYVNRLAGPVLKFTPSEPLVTAATTYTAAAEPLDSEISYTVAVDPATNDVYVAHYFGNPGIAWYDASGALLATFGRPGEEGGLFSSEGVAVGSEERVFVSNVPESGLSQVEIFGPEVIPPPGPPSVEAVSATNVTATSAVVVAKINPNSLATNYRIEYGVEDCGSSPCNSVPAEAVEVGSGHKFVNVALQLSGLQPNTTYQFRVLAENADGTNLPLESDHTFTTEGDALDFKLGDGRIWEMVSPANKHGARLISALWGHLQAADDGNGLAYLSHNPIEADPEGNRILEPSTVLALRGQGGWNSKDITSPNDHAVPLPNGQQSEFKLFSPELLTAMLEPVSGTPLSPEASERTPYLRTNSEPADYTPLVTGKEGFANVPQGTEFGGEAFIPAVRLQAASTDLSQIVLMSKAALTPGAPEQSLYRWAGGDLDPINVLPAAEGGSMAEEAVIGSNLGFSRSGSVRHAISENGLRIYWSTRAVGGGAAALYLRDIEAEETVRLDSAQGGTGSGKVNPQFQGASPDGRVVLFTDSQQLTADASGGVDLYRCEIPAGESAGGCATLTNISVPIDGSEEAAVQGVLPALSEDGSALYFVAKGVLDEVPNEFGASAEPGGYNLYFWQEGEGIRFVAPLSIADSRDWGGNKGSASGQASQVTAAGSPTGQYFIFMSQLDLTGRGNKDPESGEVVQEIFRYDAAEDDLHCVSCNPTGAAPVGQIVPNKFGLLVDPFQHWTGRRVAATVPDAMIIEVEGISLYRPRSVFNSGRVLFNAFDPLVPADSNGQWDVYQYEPTGVGDCIASSAGAAVARSGDGCVSLISSGAGEEESGFVDASATGDDAFFFTSARLSPIDVDQELDIYDARVGGRPDKAPVVTECAGEACQPFTGPPNDPTPASSAFEGPGNVKTKTCPKGKVKVKKKGKVRCVPRKHKKSQKKQKRAGHSRRAER